MALDPSTPADVKKRLRGLSGANVGVGIDAPMPASNDVFAPNVRGTGGVATTAAVPPPAPTVFDRAARGLVNFAADPGGVVAAAREALPFGNVRAGATSLGTPAPAAPAADPATAGLPEGVRRTVASGIYEGRRGLAGERVFSDNQYDPLLTVREGQGVGLRATDPAAQRVLNATPGTASAERLPAMTPKYQFASADPVASAQLVRGLSAAPETAAALDETDAAMRARLGTSDPAVLAREIATNKAALAETRAARGLGANSATGVPLTAGADGLTPEQAIDAQKAIAGIRNDAVKTELELSKEKNARGQKSYDSFFNEAVQMTPQQRRGLSAQDFATIATADRAEATPEMRANADAALERVLQSSFNRGRGGLLAPLTGKQAFTPEDLAGQAIGLVDEGSSAERLGFATDLNGNALTPEEAAAAEKAGQPIKRVRTGEDAYGFPLRDGSSFTQNPVIDSALKSYIKRRQARKRKNQSKDE